MERTRVLEGSFQSNWPFLSKEKIQQIHRVISAEDTERPLEFSKRRSPDSKIQRKCLIFFQCVVLFMDEHFNIFGQIVENPRYKKLHNVALKDSNEMNISVTPLIILCVRPVKDLESSYHG